MWLSLKDLVLRLFGGLNSKLKPEAELRRLIYHATEAARKEGEMSRESSTVSQGKDSLRPKNNDTGSQQLESSFSLRQGVSLVNQPNDENTIPELLPLYASGPDAIQKAHFRRGAQQTLLRSSSEAVARAGARDGRGSAEAGGKQETSALWQFALQEGLMLDAQGVQALMAKDPIKGGVEHKVAVLPGRQRVLKDYSTKADGALHIITSQPLVKGVHRTMEAIAAEMHREGFEQDSITKSTFHGNFEGAGRIAVTEMHEDNVIFSDRDGQPYPIDVHFSFADRVSRIKTLNAFGLWGETESHLP